MTERDDDDHAIYSDIVGKLVYLRKDVTIRVART